MPTEELPHCIRCNCATRYEGRISLPSQTIYRCETCGHQMWGATAPPPQFRPGQPSTQQQQQDQPKQEDQPKKELEE
jgi:hypothetical protein